MVDREQREQSLAAAQARRDLPAGTARRFPGSAGDQDLMVRYLQAVAAGAHHRAVKTAAATPPSAKAPVVVSSLRRRPEATRGAPVLHVDDVMRGQVASVRDDTPFLDVARLVATQKWGAVPVVDAERHIIGAVTESDLLAMAASGRSRPGGTLSALLHGRRDGDGRGTTARDVMTKPPVSVHPRTRVTDAARIAARSKVRQLFVTDYKGRLVGAVSRNDLLNALVRDEARDEARERPPES
ncbi:HPP family protein [Streptomyces sp. GC420]|uniref:CBS domain-containing protein n=1 Tax=Streptomyces sp. GC420 TaxID=2697568 RepID=UPI001414DE04|nr:CBS domain-containing protein [Streptomyces sp. GC420]NBM19746.1 CBS domain-containing protein [Streptomyces sp. GC420]